MDIIIKPVNSENRNMIENLKVFPHQKDFIEPVTECLTEADGDNRWRAVGIFNEENIPVGFAMYGEFKGKKGSRLWLDRFLIDKAYQGLGLGKKAFESVVKRLKSEYDAREIYLSVYDVNKKAIKLYKEEGFSFNGDLDTKGEKVMVYKF